MSGYANAFGPHAANTYIEHRYPEQLYDTGEVRLNYARAGDGASPPLLLIPGQTESWWGYESAMPLLAEHFNVFAVDLRGQGRSTRTPGRYTLDNMGNDLVRFIDGVIEQPTIVSGLSSGGVVAAWLSAYAKPGQLLGARYEDPPLFTSEINPAIGPSLRQGIGAVFNLWATYLGDQWSIGAYDEARTATPDKTPSWLAAMLAQLPADGPPQNLKEYDPEWGRAFHSGTFSASCDHQRMLSAVKVPVLFTHHFRVVDELTGDLIGAISDRQAAHVQKLIEGCGQPFTYQSYPQMGHSMHGQDPRLFTDILVDWSRSL